MPRSEPDFRSIAESLNDAVVSADARGVITYVNEAAERMFGRARDAMTGQPLTVLMPERLHGAHRAGLARYVRGGEARLVGRTIEITAVRADGTEFPLELSLTSHATDDGPAFVAFLRDVSGWQRAELRLSEQSSQLAEAQSLAKVGSFEWNARTGEVTWSDELYRIHGLDPADGPVTGEIVRSLIHPRDLDTVVEKNMRDLQDGQRLSFTTRIIRPDGVTKTVLVLGEAFADSDGAPLRMVGTVQDVTDQLATERERVLAEERFHQAFENAPIGMALIAIDGTWVQVNGALTRILGWSRSELLERRFQDLTHPDDLEKDLDQYSRLLVDEIRFYQIEKRYLHRDGSEVPIRLSLSLVRDADGDPLYAVAQLEDISERVRAEEAAQEGRARLQAFIDNATASVFVKDLDGRYLVANKAAGASFGLTPEDLLGRLDHDVFPVEVADAFVNSDRLALRTDGGVEGEAVVPLQDGLRSYFWQKFVLRDADGNPEAIGGISTDITERVAIEEENRRLERGLERAERLEMLGRLAGGIAHDFNNLLAVIMSYTALVADELPDDSPVSDDVAEIMRAAEGAGSLTQQLVVFGRREMVEAEVVDLNDVVRDTERLLRRTLGEDVALVTDLADDIRPVEISTTQLERILLNLAVNARDAMSTGGTLTITTQTADDRRVRLCVSDSGPGMEPGVASRAFDPFFTTKLAGEGSGLGLATVYGAVMQVGGSIDLVTEPGEGARFEIFLPAADRSVQRPPEAPPGTSPDGHGQVVMLVEDEDAVREPLTRALRRSGYEVIPAGGPDEALELAAASRTVAVLLTDVVMPGRSGSELASEMRRAYPDLAVVFMSGYPDDVMVRHGVREAEGMFFIQKPFTTDQLLGQIARALRPTRAPLTGRSPE